MVWRRWLPDKKASGLRELAVGALAAGVATLFRLPLHGAVGTSFPFLTFFPALLAAGIWGGVRGGLVCLALCGAAAFLFLSPQFNPAQVAVSLTAFLLAGGFLFLVGAALASAIIQLRETQTRMEAAEAGLQTLVGELAHRNRNGLAVVMSIVAQSARKGGSARDLADTINARLGAMAEAQDELIRGGSNKAELRTLLARTLDPFDLDRVTFEASPPVQVAGQTAAALALLSHELATNAVKYGALSVPTGRIVLAWRLEAETVLLWWRETGGPPVTTPTTEGFGTRLLARVLAAQGGYVVHRFEPEGLECEIAFPDAARHEPRPVGPPSPDPAARPAAGSEAPDRPPQSSSHGPVREASPAPQPVKGEAIAYDPASGRGHDLPTEPAPL